MGTPEKKRRLTEEVAETSISTSNTITTTPSRPPLKKRFTLNNQQAVAAAATNTTPSPAVVTTTTVTKSERVISPPPPPPPASNYVETEISNDLDSYKKDELLQKMRSAKDEALYQEKRLDLVTENSIDNETKQSLLRIDWSLIQTEIEYIAKILVGVELPEPLALFYSKLSCNQQVKWIDNNQNAIKELGTKAFYKLEQWINQTEIIDRKFRQENDLMTKKIVVSDWLKNEVTDLQASYKRGQQVMSEIQKNLDRLLEQTKLVKGNVKLAKSELGYLQEKLENCIQDLSLACKRQERSKSKLVAALSFGGLGDMPDPALVGDSDKEVKQEDDDTKTTSTAPTTPTATTLRDNGLEQQVIKTQLEEHKLILNKREKEIEELKRYRQGLLRDEERLLSLFTLSEEQLLETEYVKGLQLQIEHYRDRCHYLEQKRVLLEKEVDKISKSRQQLINQIKSEKSAQGSSLEIELRRLENDLNRIRGQRDVHLSHLEEQKQKELREKDFQDKIIYFAYQGKSRIVSLESRINKLKVDQEVAGPFAKEAVTFQHIKDSIRHVQLQLLCLESIKNNKSTTENTTTATANEEDLKKWKSNSLLQSYDTYLQDAQKSTLMIEFLEKNEGHLLEEIDRVAGIYGKLEEQQSKKTFDFSEKKDQMLKLQAEITKIAQTFPTLHAEKERNAASVPPLRLQRDKQEEKIKTMEEAEKELEQQVQEKESLIRKLAKNIDDDRTELEDINHLCEDYRITLDNNEIIINELQKTLRDKSKLLDEEKHLQDEMEQDYEKLKKKWDKISQGDNPAEQQLVDECEELRALLKCSTCRTRFRTHILTRCMHTFCKNCIDARLETRQRRCPTCSEPFGANDSKSFRL